jgi:hypothetical protein
MSYNVVLPCGCVVYVSCHPKTRIAHTRIIQSRGVRCGARRHEVGLRLFLWELLPDPLHRPRLEWADAWEEFRWSA